MRPPVITGVGVVSPFGVGARVFLGALAEGRAAVAPIRAFDASAFPAHVAGEVPMPASAVDWLVRHLADLPQGNTLAHQLGYAGVLRDRKVSFALVAALEAWRAASLTHEDRDAWLSLALGLEAGFLEDFAPFFHAEGQHGALDWSAEPDADLPATRIRAPVDLAAQWVAGILGLRGPIVVNTSACAAGALAVAHAASLVSRGEAPVVLCGASDSMLNPLGLAGMWRLGAPSPRNEPDACRPFDRRRDGMVMGEGAAMFVVETEERARARGAKPLARILGWGSTQDGWRATAPRPDGAAAARAMTRALRRAGLGPADVDYVNAHGTGTPLNDPAEARAIRAALGARADDIPVSSIKGAIGHLMAASGAIEIAACLLPFLRGLVPGTAHHRERDPECDLDVVGEKPRAARVDVAISNSFGFGGQNACVVLGRAS